MIPIPITKTTTGEEEARAAAAVVRSGWLAQGPRVAEFERVVARYVGAPHAVAVSSGTAALHLALAALGVGPGDEVILPSLSYIATANAVRYTGATPIFVDVDRRTFNLDPGSLEPSLTPRSRVLLPVHQYGLPAEIDTIRALARDRRIAVVEDAACALGAVYRKERVGSNGLCCFSFHPRKVITTGEGGMVTTGEGELAKQLQTLRAHGSTPADLRHRSSRVEALFEEIGQMGYNYRLTDVQAAVGIEQMKRLDGLLGRRRDLARRYRELLAGIEGVVTPVEPDGFSHTFQTYAVVLEGPWPREAVMQQMLDRGIATRPLMAIHQQPLYRDASRPPLPVTDQLVERGLMIPLYPQMSESDQDRVVEALTEACRG
jgi:perosamine synthetase